MRSAKLSTSDLWALAASKYRASLDESELCQIYVSALFKSLGSVSHKRCLDAGCGDGRYSQELAKRGANVTAIDNVAEFLETAEAANTNKKVKFELVNLTRKLPYQSRSFDLVFANMVLMDLPKIDLTIREFSRVLKPGGQFAFSIVHPCFFPFEWKHEDKKRAYKMVGDYFAPRTIPLEFWGKTLHFHRPLGFYTHLLQQNEFVISAMIEPQPNKRQLRKHPDWEHRSRIPSYLVVSAEKRSPVTKGHI